MKILYEDNDILICQKRVGVSSQKTPSGDGMADEVERYIGYGAVINRLDTAVGGAILFGKNQKSAAFLSKLAETRQIEKIYLAVIEGEFEEDRGVMEDLLFKDSSKNKSYVVKRERKGVKKASLEYEVIETVYENDKPKSLIKIKLHTGRTHQIRVQFSSRKKPLVGDGKYGSKDNRCHVSLLSYKISFEGQNGIVIATADVPNDDYPWNLFKINL